MIVKFICHKIFNFLIEREELVSSYPCKRLRHLENVTHVLAFQLPKKSKAFISFKIILQLNISFSCKLIQ